MKATTLDRIWCCCDDGCLYAQASLRKMRGDPVRCIKHGSILEWAGSKYDGMTREQVRAEWKRQEERNQ